MNPTAILARGPWEPEDIVVTWLGQEFEPGANASERADQALERLRQRGSPAFDGRSARLVSHEVADGKLKLVLQPVRWALRLSHEPREPVGDVPGAFEPTAAGSPAVAPVARQWAGRWALGAGGASTSGRTRRTTLCASCARSGRWRATDSGGARHASPGTIMLVGQAWLAEDARSPRTPSTTSTPGGPPSRRWPTEGDEPLLALSALVSRPDDLSDDERLVA